MSTVRNDHLPPVEIRKDSRGRYVLYRDGSPFFVKGAAGFEQIEALAAAGGNSLRTWGMEQTQLALPEVRRWGLSLCAGLWMVPPRQGFDYADNEACSRQFAELRVQILSLVNEPSLLVWGVGNELELGLEKTSPAVWKEVERVAAFLKQTDPLHPVMTVLASVDEAALHCIDACCPSLDFVSFNSYGDLERLQLRLDGIGWSRPYLITEWGANGHWEVKQTSWGAEIEPTSTEKAAQVRRRYHSLNDGVGQCLGSYLFMWGHKQERTPTWYSLFDLEGRASETVDAISALWSEKEEAGQCPRISSLRLAGKSGEESVSIKAGQWVEAGFDMLRGHSEAPSSDWWIARESGDKRVGGDEEAVAERVEARFEALAEGRVCFAAPLKEGGYRLFLEVRGPENSVATANIPFWVEGVAEQPSL